MDRETANLMGLIYGGSGTISIVLVRCVLCALLHPEYKTLMGLYPEPWQEDLAKMSRTRARVEGILVGLPLLFMLSTFSILLTGYPFFVAIPLMVGLGLSVAASWFCLTIPTTVARIPFVVSALKRRGLDPMPPAWKVRLAGLGVTIIDFVLAYPIALHGALERS